MIGNDLYYYGGGLSSVERYDPLTNSWTTVSPMSTARLKHASAALDGKLYACGGWHVSNRTALTSVERYDPDTDSWETVAPMKTARYFSMFFLSSSHF